MKLGGLDSIIQTKLRKYSRTFHIPIVDYTQQNDITRLIIVGDGTPDDCVASIICHRLNGEISVGIEKPPHQRGASTFTLLRNNIVFRKQLSKVLFLLDQEEERCDDILDRFESGCNKQGIMIDEIRNDENGHLCTHQCVYGERKIDVIVVINGLNEINTDKHRVEDHLLKAASDFGIIQLPDEKFNSKELWKDLKREQEDVFKKILSSTDVEILFPQQIKGFYYLK